MNKTNRIHDIDCQSAGKERRYVFSVRGLPPGDEYTLRLLTRDDIPVARWNRWGAPENMTREQEQELRTIGDAMREQVFTVGADGVLSLDFTVPAWTIGQLV